LENPGYADGALITVNDATEFESKIAQAQTRAKGGEKINLRFRSMEVGSERLPALRGLWADKTARDNIRFGADDAADFRVVANRHPTPASDLGSVQGWEGAIKLIIPNNPAAPGALNALELNDTVANLLSTLSVPKGAGESVFVTVDENGNPIDPVLGLYHNSSLQNPTDKD